MRLTHSLPLPLSTGREPGTHGWGLALPTAAIADAAKRVALVVAAVLFGPPALALALVLALILAAILLLTIWPVWILTAPVLGMAWLADQVRPATAHRS